MQRTRRRRRRCGCGDAGDYGESGTSFPDGLWTSTSVVERNACGDGSDGDGGEGGRMGLAGGRRETETGAEGGADCAGDATAPVATPKQKPFLVDGKKKSTAFKEHVETSHGIVRLFIVRVEPFRQPLGIFSSTTFIVSPKHNVVWPSFNLPEAYFTCESINWLSDAFADGGGTKGAS